MTSDASKAAAPMAIVPDLRLRSLLASAAAKTTRIGNAEGSSPSTAP
jgi:hypothetical protein